MVILDEWQKEFLEYKGHSLTCTGRRVGKTFVHAMKAVKRMREKKGAKIIVASLTEDQAQLIILFALDIIQKNFPTELKKKIGDTNSRKITLKNGSTMLARPVGNTGDAIRGFEADVLILDEVSRFNELILEAATPTLATTGGEIWMCSTPFGKQGFFWRAYQNKDNRYKIFKISTEEVFNNRAISDSWTEEQKQKALEFLEQERIEKSKLQYGQEYLGLFLDDLRRFYEDEWIEKVCTLERQDNVPITDNYMGVDIARLGGDLTTYEILHINQHGIAHQLTNFTEQYKLTTHTEQRIVDLTKQYNLYKVGIDAGAGSLGVGIYDHLLANPITRTKVIAMNNRTIALDREGKSTQRMMNEDYHDNLRSMGEHGEIYLLNDDDLKASFRNIQIEIVTKESGLTNVRIYGKDSHIVEGIKRAAWIVKKEKHKNFTIQYI